MKSPRRRSKAKPADNLPTATSRADPLQLAQEARSLRELLSRDARLERVDELLDGLRRQRLFKELAELGLTLGERAPTVSPTALKLTAQGLIELGRFDEAEKRLQTILEKHPGTAEALEARGLFGRIYKQRYVNACIRTRKGDASDLRRAAAEYLGAYDGDPAHPVWHGINAAAVLHRARRDGIRGLPVDRIGEVARGILSRLLQAYSSTAGYWDVATIAEAHLALESRDLAELWFHRAAWHEEADPFSLASSIRQLREVWRLDATEPPGSRILPALDARLHAGGQTHLLSPATLAKASSVPLEKVFGVSPFMPFQAWKLALECAKSVCRVEDKLEQGVGTGFLVPGKALGGALANELLLVTNAHVLSPKGVDGSLRPEDAHVTFYANLDTKGRPHASRVKKIVFFSPRDALDAAIARLEKPPVVETEMSIAPNLPSPDSKQKVYVIGHPSGGGLMFSLNDNDLLDHDAPEDPRVHYRTATEPGSSGSPVFNSAWQLIALHHAGSKEMPKIHGAGTYEANEGIAFGSIVAAVEVR